MPTKQRNKAIKRAFLIAYSEGALLRTMQASGQSGQDAWHGLLMYYTGGFAISKGQTWFKMTAFSRYSETAIHDAMLVNLTRAGRAHSAPDPLAPTYQPISDAGVDFQWRRYTTYHLQPWQPMPAPEPDADTDYDDDYDDDDETYMSSSTLRKLFADLD